MIHELDIMDSRVILYTWTIFGPHIGSMSFGLIGDIDHSEHGLSAACPAAMPDPGQHFKAELDAIMKVLNVPVVSYTKARIPHELILVL